MPVTLKDIAVRLGVSVQAVSVALSERSASARIGPELRERIRSTAGEMGYRPNRLARGLVQRRSRMLGLVLLISDYPSFAQAATGVEDEAAAAGFALLLCNALAVPRRQGAGAQVFAESQVEGVISLASSQRDKTAEVLAQKLPGIPLISINREVAGEDVTSILMRNREAACHATDHLVRAGHRRIVYLDAPDHTRAGIPALQSSIDRREGYRDAMLAAGLEARIEAVTYDGQERRVSVARDRAAAILTDANPPTAIFAVTDYEAVGVLRACLSLGLRVPDDVALFGFDDLEAGRFAVVPISSVRQPFYEAGRLAVRHLVAGGEAGAPPIVRLDCPVLCRESSGGPPSDGGGSGAAQPPAAVPKETA